MAELVLDLLPCKIGIEVLRHTTEQVLEVDITLQVTVLGILPQLSEVIAVNRYYSVLWP